MIYAPETTHTENLISRDAIGSVIAFFEQAIPSGTSLAAEDQVWPLKEVFSVLAIVSLLAFAIGIALVLLNTEIFKPLTETTDKPQPKPINKWHKIIGVLLAIAVPMLTYHKISLRLSSISPSNLFPMNWANYITWFSLVNAGILLVIFLVWFFVYGKKHVKGVEAYGLSVGNKETGGAWKKILRSLVFGIAVIFSVYFVVNLCFNIFKIDFRFWQFGIMPITLKRFSHILPYLLSFIVVFGVLNVMVIRLLAILQRTKENGLY